MPPELDGTMYVLDVGIAIAVDEEDGAEGKGGP
jgi:hypothetical protein